MIKTKTAFLIIVLVVIGFSIYYLESGKVMPESRGSESADIPVEILGEPPAESGEKSNSVSAGESSKNRIASKALRYDRAKEITTPDGFINTDRVTVSDLIGKKVILLDFWTYSCINCQRTTPYLNAWYEKYAPQGLEIIGVHTPEFEFEKKYENVARAVKEFGIKFPVVLDNDFSTWHSYLNRYWPRKYLIDIDGFIVYDHIGEGFYEETEAKIQAALKERLQVLGMSGEIDSVSTKPVHAEAVDLTKPRSPEIYFGSLRNSFLGNGRPASSAQSFSVPEALEVNKLYLSGDWQFTGEYAESVSDEAKIVFHYQGEKVFIVASADSPVTVEVFRDGAPIGAASGGHVKGSSLTIQAEQLYRLIEDPAGWGEHTLELRVRGRGLKAFTFTFG